MRRLLATRWRRRVAGAVAVYAVLEVVLASADFAPHALRLALVVGLGLGALGVLRDGLAGAATTWPRPAPAPVVPPGSETRLATYVRLVGDHLTARHPDGLLRDRLLALAEGGTADARPAHLDGPPRRLSRAEIDDHLRRLEEQ